MPLSNLPKPTQPAPPAFGCPICAARMDVASDGALPEFGALDIRLHRLACANCGMQVERAYHPSVGYKPLAR